MKKWLFLILLFPLTCVAQTYRYIGVEDGLSNRRVYCIQKDKTGYMWFLTHEGIDRYNGKDFKRYKLMDGDVEVNSLLNLNWLYIDQEGVLWEIKCQFEFVCQRFEFVVTLNPLLQVFHQFHLDRKSTRLNSSHRT